VSLKYDKWEKWEINGGNKINGSSEVNGKSKMNGEVR